MKIERIESLRIFIVNSCNMCPLTPGDFATMIGIVTLPGVGGQIRVVDVKKINKTYRSPVVKLFRIPCEEDVEKEESSLSF